MRSKRILLVEDNPDDLELMLISLRESNLFKNVDVVRDGVEALEYLFAEGQYAGRDIENLPELILLDLKLPRLSGMDVLKRVRADPRTRLIPIVMLTSSKEDVDVASCYENGANGYVQKPVDFDQFIETVKSLGTYWLVLNESPIVRG